MADIETFDIDTYKKISGISPSIFNSQLKFISEYGNKICFEYIQTASKYINRYDVVMSLSKMLMNINTAIEIEAGIFEHAMVYVLSNNLEHKLMYATYNDKYNDIKRMFDRESQLYNKTLKKKVISGTVSGQHIAFMSPHEICPKIWKKLIDKRNLIEYKKNNMAVTDLYKCYKCGKRRCQVTQQQTRGADEQVSTIVVCTICHNRWMC